MSTRSSIPPRRVYTPSEVAELFRVDARTVTRWARIGRLPKGSFFVTPGKHRRYWADEIDALRRGEN